MKTNNNQSGFSVIAIVSIIVAVALVGLLGYVAYDRFFAANDADNVAEQSAVADDVDTEAPQTIDKTSDLDAALKSLEQIDDESTVSDTKLIDEQLAEF